MESKLFQSKPVPDSKVVDRVARDKAALLLRRFASGRISNDAFEDEAPVTADPIVWAIWHTAWSYYSDFREHRLEGADRLHPDAKRAWIRWILFLDSELRYEWPPIHFPGNDPAAAAKGDVLSWFGLRQPVKSATQMKFENAGHYPVWPFISQKDYRNALKNPRRLKSKELE